MSFLSKFLGIPSKSDKERGGRMRADYVAKRGGKPSAKRKAAPKAKAKSEYNYGSVSSKNLSAAEDARRKQNKREGRDTPPPAAETARAMTERRKSGARAKEATRLSRGKAQLAKDKQAKSKKATSGKATPINKKDFSGKVESTKGGVYPKYKAGSKTGNSFKSAFAAARKANKKVFTWEGRKYNTKLKSDSK